MAERERITNKERRSQGRAERQQRELERQRQRKRAQLRNGLVTFVVVAVIAVVVLQAFLGRRGTTIDETIVVSRTGAESASEAAGCQPLVIDAPLPVAYHFEPSQAPNLASIYTDTRPTHSGPHTTSTHPITPRASRQISEAATTHNLEHGSIIVWWDPDQVERSVASDIGRWAERLNANGFRVDQLGVGILSSPYEDPGISSGKAIALRAWGNAIDCDRWDETVANAFVINHFGTNGISPEGMFGPYPSGVLEFDTPPPEPEDPEGENPEGEGAEGEGAEGEDPEGEGAEGGAEGDQGSSGTS